MLSNKTTKILKIGAMHLLESQIKNPIQSQRLLNTKDIQDALIEFIRYREDDDKGRGRTGVKKALNKED